MILRLLPLMDTGGIWKVEQTLRDYDCAFETIKVRDRHLILLHTYPDDITSELLQHIPGVEKAVSLLEGEELLQPATPLTIDVHDRTLGPDTFTVIAGPCTVAGYEQLHQTVEALRERGIHWFRGGAYKMRTSPRGYEGMGVEGLELIHRVAEETGSVSVSEVVAVADVPLVAEHVDVLQIGTRNMQNVPLLRAAGESGKPVLLKRGMSATYREWTQSVEYLRNSGCEDIILCERGIRTFETLTRNTLDLTAVPVMHILTGLPVIVDPSHSTGHRSLVVTMALAAAGAGADGILTEALPCPENGVCDWRQTIDLAEIDAMLPRLKTICAAWEKRLN